MKVRIPASGLRVRRGGRSCRHGRRVGRARVLLPLTAAAAALWMAAAAQRSLAAQEPTPDATPAARCDGGDIVRIDIVNHSIYSAPEADSSAAEDRSGPASDLARAVANRAHIRTRRELIAAELLFEEGDCLDPLLLTESERILRELPFIAEARVEAERQADGSVVVAVETRDDWTLKLDVRPEWDEGFRFTHVGVTEENLLGAGVLLGFYLRQRDEVRDLGADLRTVRTLGTRLDTRLTAGRTRTGVFFTETLSYPFVGEVGKWAFVESWSLREDLFPFAAGPGSDFTSVSLPIQTRYGELTLGRRFGTPGRLTVAALGAGWEDIRFEGYPGGVETVSQLDFSVRDTADAATAEVIRHQVTPRRGAFLNLLVGRRVVRFETRRGLDAIRGVQDVRLGTEVLGALGVSAPGNDEQELRGRVTFFGGGAGSNWVFSSELNLEGSGRIGAGAPTRGSGAANGVHGVQQSFRDILGEFRAQLYWHPSSSRRHTVVAAVAGAGGWRNTIPFQLTLGGRSGVRGYSREELPAAQRVVARIEDRIMLDGPLRQVVDLGVVLFVDVGAGWGGDAPFGIDSGVRGAFGAGLRVALPAGARQPVRLDMAVPMGDVSFDRIQFRIGYDATSLLNRLGDWQVRRSRASGPAAAFLGAR